MLEITRTRKYGKHQQAEHWIAVSTLLGVINSTDRDPTNNHSMQKPKLYHWAIGS